ncbi:hypothetical protein [Streptomyces sp. HC307]|uniref:hypothetical protein n=1 Tax=Streptomyces flavusporus TaxID=3385496 RepID=UPI00391716AE
MSERPGRQPQWVNLTMHFGQGALLGILRSAMAHAGLRGPWASAQFAVVRLANDQILTNATCVGAPPQTWSRRELAVGLLHKAVHAFTTGAVADALAGPTGPGQRHAAFAPAADHPSAHRPGRTPMAERTRPRMAQDTGRSTGRRFLIPPARRCLHRRSTRSRHCGPGP